MAGRPRLFETELLIDRAIEVFWARGYGASSTENLLKAMQIGQGSFYATFKGGKSELFQKSLLRFSDKAMKAFNDRLKQSDDSVKFLRTFFLSLADSSQERKQKGCFLGNTIVESAETDVQLKNTASMLLTRLENQFKAIIEQAQQNKRITNTTPAELIAKHLITLWNGINITQRLYPEDKSIRAVIELNLSILH